MQKIINKIIDAAPFFFVGLLLWIVLGQFIDAQRELQTSRQQCYASIGKEACERDVQ